MRSAAVATLLLALAAASVAQGGEPTAAVNGDTPVLATTLDQGLYDQEIQLAKTAFDQGLYEFVVLRLEKLTKRMGFDHADRAELLLAESLYLSGRRPEAMERFAGFQEKFPASPHLLECQVWTGRAMVEVGHKPKEAEGHLRPLLQELLGAAGLAIEDRIRTRLISECRYFLCLSMVDQGRSELLDDLWDQKHTRLMRSGALRLLAEQVRSPEGSRFVADAHVLRGRALCMSGRLTECFDLLQAEFLDKAIGQTGPALRAQAFYWQAEARYGQARWEDAARLYGRSAEEAAAAGSAGWRHRALYGCGWARQKQALDLRRRGTAGDGDLLGAALGDFDLVAKGVSEHDDPSLAASAQLRAGEVLVLLGRHSEAISRLEPLYSDAARGIEARYLAATAATELGNHDRADELLLEALKKIPEHREAMTIQLETARGQNLFAKGDWDGAIRTFARVIELSGTRSDRAYQAQLWTARALANRGRFPEAIGRITPLIENRQAREALRQDCLDYHLGEVLLSQARSDRNAVMPKTGRDARAEAVRLFVEAYQISPLGSFAIPARFGAAEAYLLMEPASSQEALQQYKEILQDRRAKPAQREEARLGMARALKSSRSYRKAAELLQSEIIEARPEASPPARRKALRLRAELLAEGGEAEAAAAAYQMLARDLGPGPEAARARMQRAEQLTKLARHDEAAKELSALSAACPPELRATVAFAAAGAEEAAGRPANALKRYLEHVELGGPRRAEAHLQAARLTLAAGRAQEAEALARKCLDELALAPDKGDGKGMLAVRARLVRAGALMAMADPATAAGQYRRAADDVANASTSEAPVERDGAELALEALMGLGQALLKAGQNEDAAASFLRAANLLARQPEGQIGAALTSRATQALPQAALALQEAGHPKAAQQIRAILSAKGAAERTPPSPAPVPAPPALR